MSEEILIRIKADEEYDDYEGNYVNVHLKHEQVTFQELLDENKTYLFSYHGFAMIDPKKGITKETAELLRNHGWVHKDTAVDREERKVVEQEYYLLDENGKNSYYFEPKFSKINIDNLTDDQLKQLAKSGKIVQVVSAKSILPDSQYKKLQTKKKQIEEQKTKASLTAAKKLAKKKAKEIENAKKLLEESGIKVT